MECMNREAERSFNENDDDNDDDDDVLKPTCPFCNEYVDTSIKAINWHGVMTRAFVGRNIVAIQESRSRMTRALKQSKIMKEMTQAYCWKVHNRYNLSTEISNKQ